VILWLWEASGPTSSASGVCGEEAAARGAAALVEEAQLVVGTASLMQYYERTGQRWEARPGRRIRWHRALDTPCGPA
jgi:hypothetical protein